jgi:hypothetical protein
MGTTGGWASGCSFPRAVRCRGWTVSAQVGLGFGGGREEEEGNGEMGEFFFSLFFPWPHLDFFFYFSFLNKYSRNEPRQEKMA